MAPAVQALAAVRGVGADCAQREAGLDTAVNQPTAPASDPDKACVHATGALAARIGHSCTVDVRDTGTAGIEPPKVLIHLAPAGVIAKTAGTAKSDLLVAVAASTS